MSNQDFIEKCKEAVELIDSHILSGVDLELSFCSNPNFLFMKEHISSYLNELKVKFEMHPKVEIGNYKLKIIFK